MSNLLMMGLQIVWQEGSISKYGKEKGEGSE